MTTNTALACLTFQLSKTQCFLSHNLCTSQSAKGDLGIFIELMQKFITDSEKNCTNFLFSKSPLLPSLFPTSHASSTHPLLLHIAISTAVCNSKGAWLVQKDELGDVPLFINIAKFSGPLWNIPGICVKMQNASHKFSH